jgi:hypothetical protein
MSAAVILNWLTIQASSALRGFAQSDIINWAGFLVGSGPLPGSLRHPLKRT